MRPLFLLVAAITIPLPHLNAQTRTPFAVSQDERPLKGIETVSVIVNLHFKGSSHAPEVNELLPDQRAVMVELYRRLRALGLTVVDLNKGSIDALVRITVDSAMKGDTVIFGAKTEAIAGALIRGQKLAQVTIWSQYKFGMVGRLKSTGGVFGVVQELMQSFESDWRVQNQ